MKLPNPECAIVEIEKIAGYCLNPEHPEGKHKARVFKSALDLNLNDAEELRSLLLRAVANYDAISGKSNPYGQKYIIDFPVTRANKEAVIHSVWILRNNENFPRLVTCYVL
ncbi:hypothetical protein G7B40_040520 [Aetokthonos hydrillicola Thurmond2011]|jgi:hypothetical protein|uniref:DUF6883 domain-containing protein n=1 Tax=Aetokthonos hydrillicola Thurmond2011 TaxID=2712845 RepID=A0AAP5IH67_9CYAN|nr:DUF6883 domain-containing protein [Aetokthonos hydrillicola]MBO3461026.1 hypothetical protein [Aetokthonos hydrillicola CCALA 1050]MBW4588405.1 hypothetical protein [Aetokthonos hydrillicola CCALA 1050]MDR9900774.1 hypothetical protein [Aetokthonos hydrillicola Thurmond2011]